MKMKATSKVLMMLAGALVALLALTSVVAAQDLTIGGGSIYDLDEPYGSYDFQGVSGGFGFTVYGEDETSFRQNFSYDGASAGYTFENEFEIGDNEFVPAFRTFLSGRLGNTVQIAPSYEYVAVSWTDSVNANLWKPGVSLSVGGDLLRVAGYYGRAYSSQSESLQLAQAEIEFLSHIQIRGGIRESQLALADVSHNAYFIGGTIIVPLSDGTAVVLTGEYNEDCVIQENYFTGFVGLRFK